MQCELTVYQAERIQEGAELSPAFKELSVGAAEGRRDRQEKRQRFNSAVSALAEGGSSGCLTQLHVLPFLLLLSISYQFS